MTSDRVTADPMHLVFQLVTFFIFQNFSKVIPQIHVIRMKKIDFVRFGYFIYKKKFKKTCYVKVYSNKSYTFMLLIQK